MKRLVLLLCVLMLVACAGVSSTNSVNPQEETTKLFFDALIAEKYAEANNYLDKPMFDESKLDDITSKIFSSITYSNIKLLSQDGATASVTVDVSGKDLDKIVENWLMAAISYALANPNVSDEERTVVLQQQLMDTLATPDAPTKQANVTLTLTQADGRWLIVTNEAFARGVFVGIADSEILQGYLNQQ